MMVIIMTHGSNIDDDDDSDVLLLPSVLSFLFMSVDTFELLVCELEPCVAPDCWLLIENKQMNNNSITFCMRAQMYSIQVFGL